MARKKASKASEDKAVNTSEVKAKKEEVKEEVKVEAPVEPTPAPVAPVATVVEAPAPKPKKKSIAPFLLIGVVAILLVVGIVVRIIISSPKQVFTSYINHAYKEVSNTLKEIEEIYQPDKEAVEIKATMKIDSNMDSEELMDADFDIKI